MINRLFSWFESRIDPYPDLTPKTPEKGLVRFIWSNLNGLRGWLAVLVVLTAGVGITEALVFQFMGTVIDWFDHYAPAELMVEKRRPLILMLAIMLFAVVWKFLALSIRLQTLQGAFPMRLRWNFHRLMLGQSLGFYQDEFAGRVSAKVMQTALAVRDVVISIVDMAVHVIVYFITSGIILVALNSWLLLPFVVWAVGFGAMMVLLIPKLDTTSRMQADARSLMTGRITDAYSNIATVKLFSHSAREAYYAKQSMQEFMLTVHAQMRLVSLINVGSFLMSTVLTISTVAVGIWLWGESQIGAGTVAAATAMSLRIAGLSHYIMWESARLFENIGVVNDGMATLSKSHTIIDKPDALPLKVSKGGIHFEHIDFSYEAGKPLLNNFNLTIRNGEKVGLIGRSGAGKSTIVNLLLRFYEPQSGKILIDGQNITHITQESLRAQIGLVTQDTGLLHRSVRENIVYGRPDASEESMIQAAEQAEAAAFIAGLYDAKGRRGYDAHVGERGVKLSGGQRQRIAIARVMLKNAPILLLDEATSALDSEVETVIQENLDKIMENKTVIAIAHRLSTIAAMDRLIVLDQGRIVEEGSHNELLAKNGLYAKLWRHQSGGFLISEV